ncbi:MAG: formimidoylglutamate deiminase [Acidimicrobiales bacterium]
MTARTWWAEMAWLGGPDAVSGVRIDCNADGTIIDVVPGAPRPENPGIEVLRGLTVPGLVNCHSHAFHRALRAWTQSAGGDFWSWRTLMYQVAERIEPDAYLDLATAVYAEMLLAGITTVGEFHYLHHDRNGRAYQNEAMEAAIVEAARTAGIRITVLDTCYLTGGIGPASEASLSVGPGVGALPAEPLQGAQRRFSDGSVDGWLARLEAASRSLSGPTVRFGAAVHSVRAVPREGLDEIAAAMAPSGTGPNGTASSGTGPNGTAPSGTGPNGTGRSGMPIHAHVSEQTAENAACVRAWGLTPTQLLGEAGLLGPAFTAVHATHLEARDVDLLGTSGSSVCVCPTTERDLADGIGPTVALRRAGVPLCLGSDSHAVIDLLEEARAVELDERLASGRRGSHSPADLLQAATGSGSRSLGWEDVGRIAVGAQADLCSFDLSGVDVAGTFTARGANAASALVFATRGASPQEVVVAGRTVVKDGHHVGLGDVAKHMSEAIAAVMGRGE